jgi:hypothetical protein
MSVSYRAPAWLPLRCPVTGLIAFCASARATILFGSLDSPNPAASTPGLDATFATGASIFHATDIALLLSGGVAPPPDETFTVSLEGGVPLADVSFDPVLGLNIFPGGPVLGAVTLPVSNLSTSLAIEHFSLFASIALQPNSLYWIGVTADSDPEDNPVNWGYTSDVSGVGVAENYNSQTQPTLHFSAIKASLPSHSILRSRWRSAAPPRPAPRPGR